MKHAPLSLALVALAFGAAGCTPGKEDKPPTPKVTSGETRGAAAPALAALPKLGPAPTWELKDLEGKPVRSDQFKGKVVVVDFWATWCGPCRVEIPGYVELQKKYGSEGLVIVGASIDQGGPDIVKAFAAKAGINYTMVMADEAVAAAFGGVNVIPTTFLIDRNGQIRDRKEGAEEKADYEKKLLAVFAEKT